LIKIFKIILTSVSNQIKHLTNVSNCCWGIVHLPSSSLWLGQGWLCLNWTVADSGCSSLCYVNLQVEKTLGRKRKTSPTDKGRRERRIDGRWRCNFSKVRREVRVNATFFQTLGLSSTESLPVLYVCDPPSPPCVFLVWIKFLTSKSKALTKYEQVPL
jgi:hypothetical protein